MIKFKYILPIFSIFFSFFINTTNLYAKEFSPKNIYKDKSKAVVFIFASNGGNSGMGGTGSIIREDGLIITNAHVVIDDKTSEAYKVIYVFLKPEKIYGDMDRDLSNRHKADIIYYDNEFDLALLKIDNPNEKLSKIEFANPEDIDIGEDVAAIGHPEQGGLWTLTTGTISTVKANFEGVKGKDVFQTEASINKGNSGGPLLDKRGYMVGVNSNIARKSQEGIAITDINFSIKSSVAKDWLKNNGYQFDYGTMPMTDIIPPPDTQHDIKTESAPKEEEKIPHETVPVETPPVVYEKEVKKPEEKVEPKPEIKESEKPAPVVKIEETKKADSEAKVVEKTKPLHDAKADKKEDNIITEKRPYNLDKLVKDWAAKVEAEMEGVMKEMKKKTDTSKKKDIFDEF